MRISRSENLSLMDPCRSNAGSRPGVLLEIRDTKTGDVMQAQSIRPAVSMPAADLEIPRDVSLPAGR